jgi:uncharacterized protein (TIGR03437 family)
MRVKLDGMGRDASPSRLSSRATVRVWVMFGFVSSPLMPAQPVIAPGGIVNAASFKPDPDRGIALTGGQIATIFGSNLAASTATAQGYPLPAALAGAAVTYGGVSAPLFYVSPGQINFQVPTRGDFLSSLQTIVTTTGGTSDHVVVNGAYAAVGIFTQDGSGCGPGAVQNVNPDGSVTLNTQSHSASPGDWISIFATGLGFVYPAPPDSFPATTTPLSSTPGGAGVQFGLTGFSRGATAVLFSGGYAGRAPGLVGVDQVNVQVPADALEGCTVPLTVVGDTIASQPVAISIRKGGGPCQDAPLSRVGSLNWAKTVTTGPTTPASTILESLRATLVEAPANQLQPPSSGATAPVYPSDGFGHTAPNCAGSAGRRLNVGAVTVQGVTGSPFTFSPSSASGELIYQATLPAGTNATGNRAPERSGRSRHQFVSGRPVSTAAHSNHDASPTRNEDRDQQAVPVGLDQRYLRCHGPRVPGFAGPGGSRVLRDFRSR